MILAPILTISCLSSVAAQRWQHSSATDGLAIAGRARRNLRKIQDVINDASEETAALEEDEVPFVDGFADQSMSMLMLVDNEVCFFGVR